MISYSVLSGYMQGYKPLRLHCLNRTTFHSGKKVQTKDRKLLNQSTVFIKR